MIKDVFDYIFDECSHLEYYANTYLEKIAFLFMSCIAIVLTTITTIFLFITCPLWIIPYLIYKRIKENKHGRFD